MRDNSKNSNSQESTNDEEVRRNGVVFAETSEDRKSTRKNRTSRNGLYTFSLVVFIVVFLLVFAIMRSFTMLWLSIAVSLICGIIGSSAIHITLQWEKAVVLRLGRLNRVAGPGIYFTIPIIEYTTIRIDQRMRCTYFSGEQILTADLVPVDVDAVFFWTVWDAQKASTEVEDYSYSVSRTAQACMRDVIGSMEIEEMATRRNQIDDEIRDRIASLTEQWGISVPTVKIRNIIIPKDLQDAMSKAAQAQRERDARIILAEIEKDVSAMLVEAANVYDQNEHALQLRAMEAVNEGLKDKGGMIVVPNSLGGSFGNTLDFLKNL